MNSNTKVTSDSTLFNIKLELGKSARGKYTFLIIVLEFLNKCTVCDTLLDNIPQTKYPAMAKIKIGMSPVDRRLILLNTKESISTVAMG
jgi:hypothetical protein